MQIRELLKKGEIQNRSDIIAEIEHLNGVKSVKAGKGLYLSQNRQRKRNHAPTQRGFLSSKTSKLELMQSGLERRKEADQLNASLQLLSKTLRDFLTLTEQSELPIMQSTMLLGRMEETIKAIESNLISISTEIENLSPNP